MQVIDGATRPANWDERPYAREDGWTDAHRAFRDWLMNELVLSGCEIRTLSPMGMAQVTVEHMVRQGWSASPPAAEPDAEDGALDSEAREGVRHDPPGSWPDEPEFPFGRVT